MSIPAMSFQSSPAQSILELLSFLFWLDHFDHLAPSVLFEYFSRLTFSVVIAGLHPFLVIDIVRWLTSHETLDYVYTPSFSHLDELACMPFSLLISLVVVLLVLLALLHLVRCSTPISEISTRAFVAYSWFGLPPCVHSQVYIRYGTQVRVGAQSRIDQPS